MKKYLLAAVAALALGGTASAQTLNCQTYGSSTFCNGPNGYHSNQQTYGSSTFGNDSQGNSWNTQRYGGSTFTNINPGYRRGW